MICGVAADTKDSAFIPRFLVYHSLVAGMDFTVRTRWSREVIVHAILVVILSDLRIVKVSRRRMFDSRYLLRRLENGIEKRRKIYEGWEC